MIHHSIPRSARTVLAALVISTVPALLHAQVSLYEYSGSVETYTEVTAAEASYSLGIPTYFPPLHNMRAWVNNEFFGADGQVTNGGYLSGVYGPGYPIGFDFTYNGQVFDVIGVSHSGWISFGKTSDGNQAVWAYAGDHPHAMPFVQYIGGPDVPYKRNRVAGFGSPQLRMQDQSSLDPPGPVSSIRLATLGAAPNRVFVVQFKDFRASYSSSSTLINFQIRLNEVDNSVEVRFGDVVFGYESGGNAQVGLGGSVPEDFNSRMTVYEQPAFLYDWNTTGAGQMNTDACLATTEQFGHPNGSGVPPVEGLNFKWTPAVCPPPAWPLTITDISYDYASAQWESTVADEYEYFVSTADSITGPEAASGTTTDTQASFFGLESATTYYVFVRSICAGEEGIWSLGTPFRTLGGGTVVCDGTTMTEDYCSHQNDVVSWLYVSGDGSPLKIEFLGGYIGNVTGGSFKIWNGSAPTGTPDLTLVGDITGQFFLSASGQIYIQLTTDNGSCETQPWFLPLQWKVGCKNCTDPLVNYSIGDVDCTTQEYFIDVDIFSLGSSTTLSLENSLGLPATTVSITGVHAVGPFPSGENVTITAQNPDNEMCYSTSAALVNEPCAIVDCGPTWYTKCASPSEVRDWLVQGDGGPISVRFPPANLGWDAQVKVFDGADEMAPSQTVTASGITNNQLVTSTNAQHQLLIRYVASQYTEYACSEGNSLPLEFVVECGDACVQPTATFTYAECTEAATFNVVVDLTTVGSTGSVTITNDGAAPNVVATAVGSYTVGPFPSASVVELEIEGANEVCSWTSTKLTKDCSTIGIAENTTRKLNLYPNPSEGSFFLSIPTDVSGSMDLQVQDITGRVVAMQNILNGASHEVVLELGHLPNGAYFVVLNTNSQRFIGRVQVVH
ncbi:MAG: T9SS type A sorting domain-containing protein [Flavobacteriales bacterium]